MSEDWPLRDWHAIRGDLNEVKWGYGDGTRRRFPRVRARRILYIHYGVPDNVWEIEVRYRSGAERTIAATSLRDALRLWWGTRRR